MKSILAVALIAGLAAAEVPSHSYLPPPPNRGYSSGPAVVSARTIDQTRLPGDHYNGDHNGEHTTNGFARSSQPAYDHTPSPQARFGDEQGYDQNNPGYPRNGLEDVNATVNYEAEERGFKPQNSYEDSQDLARSSPSYDTNANNFRANNGYHGNEQDGAHNGYHGNEQNGDRPNARSNGYN